MNVEQVAWARRVALDGRARVIRESAGFSASELARAMGAQVTLDYPNAQGVTLNTSWDARGGAAQLRLAEMPDPTLPPDKAVTTDRVVLGCSNKGDGALLAMFDSAEKPRILLNVGAIAVFLGWKGHHLRLTRRTFE